MSSNIGLHITPTRRDGFGDFLRKLRAAGVELPGVHVVDDFGVAAEIKGILPNTRVIGRVNDLDGQHLGEWQIEWNGDPRGAAEDYYLKVVKVWDVNPAVDTWSTLNEVNNSFYPQQADFFIRLLELTDRPLCLFNSSVGTPDYWSNDHEPYESVARTCKVAKASELPHVLGLHEYAFIAELLEETHEQDSEGNYIYPLGPHLVLRYRRLFSYLEGQNALIPIVLTEVGQNGGYRFVGDDAWMNDMAWYDSETRKDDYIEFIASWNLGDWDNANIQSVLPHLANYLIAEYTLPPDEPDDPPIVDRGKPRFDYKRIVNVVPPDDPLLNAQSRYTYRLTGNENRAVSIFLGGWRRGRETTGGSYDDAFVADLTHRLGRLFDIESDNEQEFVTFRDDWYSGGVIDFRESVDLSESDEPEPPPESDTLELIWPVAGKRIITSPFGQRPSMGDFHYGVDMRANEETRVYVAADGIMEFAGYDTSRPDGGFGFYIRIGHDRGKDVYLTYYAHLEDGPDNRGLLWPVGEKLEQGLHTAYANNTGHSFGSHLHFGLKKNGVWVDPIPYLRADQKPESPEPPPEPTHKPLKLLHLKAAAGGTITDDAWQTDMAMLRDAKMDGAKWTSNNQLESIDWVKASTGLATENMIIRLYFHGTDPSLINASRYFELQYQWINWAQNAGMLIEIHNEPNLTDEWPESANAFARWFADVATMIHARWPNARVGFPGLSPQPNTKAFYEACYDAIRTHADWIGVHCYFSVDGSGAFGIDNNSADQAGGLYWQRVIDWIPPNIPIWITEFADNGENDDFEAKARRTKEYFMKDYPLRIEGLACYISQDSNFPEQAWDKNPHMVAAVAGRGG